MAGAGECDVRGGIGEAIPEARMTGSATLKQV